MTRIRKAGAFLSVALAATVPTIGGAGATVLACGQTITQSTTLTADVGACAAGGIIIGADGITFDLGGYRIFGTANAGDGAGVLLQGRVGVTVRNGTVTNFDGGVVVLGGQRNTITGITARDNIGAAFGQPGATTSLYADGILIQGSRSNLVLNNVAVNNGPLSGIGVIRGDSAHPAIPPADAPFNTFRGNVVNGNIACRRGTAPFCDNDGIRIEPAVTDTQVLDNQVNNNGLDGISLFGATTRNVVRGNQVVGNGFRGAVPGDGIRVFGFGNTIENNTASRNAAGGVSVARRPPTAGSFPAANVNGRGNTLKVNNAFGNGSFDLWDSNRLPDCGTNVWSGNQGGTASPTSCVRNP